LRVAVGGVAVEALDSVPAVSRRLLDAGFHFADDTLDAVIAAG
jgi:hypothetical protein